MFIFKSNRVRCPSLNWGGSLKENQVSVRSVAVLVGPSGVGKDTLIDLIVSISDYKRFPAYTTRHRRNSEVDGVHYNFVDHTGFVSLFQRGSLLEQFEVNGEFYGLCLEELKSEVGKGKKCILHLSVEGLLKLKTAGVEVTSVWIQPPYPDALVQRLRKRGLSEKEISARICHYSSEIGYESIFDFKIVNYDNKEHEVAEIIADFLSK